MEPDSKAIPTLVLLNGGKVIHTFVGAHSERGLLSAIEAVLGSQCQTESKQNL